jgi:hypothetical protein
MKNTMIELLRIPKIGKLKCRTAEKRDVHKSIL